MSRIPWVEKTLSIPHIIAIIVPNNPNPEKANPQCIWLPLEAVPLVLSFTKSLAQVLSLVSQGFLAWRALTSVALPQWLLQEHRRFPPPEDPLPPNGHGHGKVHWEVIAHFIPASVWRSFNLRKVVSVPEEMEKKLPKVEKVRKVWFPTPALTVHALLRAFRACERGWEGHCFPGTFSASREWCHRGGEGECGCWSPTA